MPSSATLQTPSSPQRSITFHWSTFTPPHWLPFTPPLTWSLFKRNLRGTYVSVEPFHLDRYLDEQVFRFNNRATKDNPLNDSDRFLLAMSQVAGRRLTYAQLTGKGTDSLHHPATGAGEAEVF